MTVKQHLTKMKNSCKQKSERRKDSFIKNFYANAAEGFDMKIRRLTKEEAAREYVPVPMGH